MLHKGNNRTSYPGRYKFGVMRIAAHIVTAAVTCILLAGQNASRAAEDAYPDRPIKLIVPMPAGTTTDATARLFSHYLGTDLNGTVIIENKPGAATNIGALAVARAPKDGYTLLLSGSSYSMNVSLFRKVPIDVLKDFRPIAMVASNSFILVTHPSIPANNLIELIAYAKAHPDSLNFATTGVGTGNHLAASVLESRAGIKVAKIYYKGSAEAVTDILAGRSHAMFAPPISVVNYVESGRLRAIASTGLLRSSISPNVPTMSEAGISKFNIEMWLGVFAPAGIPSDVVTKLSDAVTKVVRSADFDAKIKAMGADPVVLAGDKFSDFIKEDIERWADAVSASGIKPLDNP